MAVVEAGLSVVAQDGASCEMCAKHAAEAATGKTDRNDDLLPWGLALTGAVLVASVGVGADHWFGLGAIAGIAVAAGCAWLTFRSVAKRSRARHTHELERLGAEGDGRVAMVVRQFEWAVNDVVKLRRDVERAEASADLLVGQARQRERHMQKLERQLVEARERLATLVSPGTTADRPEFDPLTDAITGVIPFAWALHNDRYQVSLELECGITPRQPTRVRVVDAYGKVVLTSSTPMWSDGGRPSFSLASPPADLIVDLDAGREPRYTIQALSEYEWREVRLEDSGRRSKIVTDKAGRLYRVTDEPDMAQFLSTTHASATLN